MPPPCCRPPTLKPSSSSAAVRTFPLLPPLHPDYHHHHHYLPTTCHLQPRRQTPPTTTHPPFLACSSAAPLVTTCLPLQLPPPPHRITPRFPTLVCSRFPTPHLGGFDFPSFSAPGGIPLPPFPPHVRSFVCFHPHPFVLDISLNYPTLQNLLLVVGLWWFVWMVPHWLVLSSPTVCLLPTVQKRFPHPQLLPTRLRTHFYHLFLFVRIFPRCVEVWLRFRLGWHLGSRVALPHTHARATPIARFYFG